MISLTTNVCIVWKRLIFMIAFIGAIIFGTSVSHAAYIAPPSTVGEAVVLIDADTKEILFAKTLINGCTQQVLQKWLPC